MKKRLIVPESGNDAIFLPSALRGGRESLHGCEDELYIVYYNESANFGNGSFEIEIVDRETLIELYEYTKGSLKQFFELMPDFFQGKWKYADKGYSDYYESIYFLYNDADFIIGRDGGIEEEYNFIFDWLNINKKTA